MRFVIKRRIFSPILLNSIGSLSEYEVNAAYNLILKKFLKEKFSMKLTESEVITLTAIAIKILQMEEKIKNDQFNEKYNNNVEDINDEIILKIQDRKNKQKKLENVDEFIQSNIYRVLPISKKNIVNNFDNFMRHIKPVLNTKQLNNSSLKNLQEFFIEKLRIYEFYFSSVFNVKLENYYNPNNKETKNNNQAEIPDDFIFIINCINIQILDSIKCDVIFKVNFNDIIFVYFDGLSSINFCFLGSKQNEDSKNIMNNVETETNKAEIKIKFSSNVESELRIIIEDIISYIQLKIATEKQSLLTNVEIQEKNLYYEKTSNKSICDLKDYRLAFQRKLPFLIYKKDKSKLKENDFKESIEFNYEVEEFSKVDMSLTHQHSQKLLERLAHSNHESLNNSNNLLENQIAIKEENENSSVSSTSFKKLDKKISKSNSIKSKESVRYNEENEANYSKSVVSSNDKIDDIYKETKNLNSIKSPKYNNNQEELINKSIDNLAKSNEKLIRKSILKNSPQKELVKDIKSTAINSITNPVSKPNNKFITSNTNTSTNLPVLPFLSNIPSIKILNKQEEDASIINNINNFNDVSCYDSNPSLLEDHSHDINLKNGNIDAKEHTRQTLKEALNMLPVNVLSLIKLNSNKNMLFDPTITNKH